MYKITKCTKYWGSFHWISSPQHTGFKCVGNDRSDIMNSENQWRFHLDQWRFHLENQVDRDDTLRHFTTSLTGYPNILGPSPTVTQLLAIHP